MDPDLASLPPPPRDVPFAVRLALRTNGGVVFAAMWLGFSSLVALGLDAANVLVTAALIGILIFQALGILILLAAYVYGRQRIHLLRHGVLNVGTVTQVVLAKQGMVQKGESPFETLPAEEAVKRFQAQMSGPLFGPQSEQVLAAMKRFESCFNVLLRVILYGGGAMLALFILCVALDFPVRFNDKYFLLAFGVAFFAVFVLIGTVITRGHRRMMRLRALTEKGASAARLGLKWPDVQCEFTYTLDSGETGTADDSVHLQWLADFGLRCPILHDPARPRQAMLLVGPRVPAGVSPTGEWEPLSPLAASFVRLLFILAGLGVTMYGWATWPWG